MKLIRKPENTTWSIDQFKLHPLQEDYFRWEAGISLRELANDIRRNGLRERIETVAGGVIVAGHRRWRAILQHLPELHAAVPVCIRWDLVAKGDVAIERYFLESNLLRRHMTPLEMARAYKRLKQLNRADSKSRAGSDDSQPEEDYRTQLAKRFGFRSHRQLDRLCTLLELPIPVQKAYELKRVTQAAVLRLHKAPPELQQEAARLATNGNLNMKSLNKLLLGSKSRPRIVEKDFPRMWRTLGKLCQELRYSFPASFEFRRPQTRADEEVHLKRLRSFVRLADEVRRRYFPDYSPTNVPMKPIIKWPAAVLLERLLTESAGEQTIA